MSSTGGKSRGGFTLIELSVVLVVIGIIISIVATVLPGLIQSGKIRKAEALMERAETSLEGYLIANFRLPCPDTDDDGRENLTGGAGSDCAAYVGVLPYLDLGLATPDDAWNNPMRYGVYGAADTAPDLTNDFADGDDLCTGSQGLEAAAATAFDNGRVHTAADSDCGGAASDEANQAFVIVSGGVKALDAADGFFDCFNGDPTAVRFNRPNKFIDDTTYDDLVRGAALTSLVSKACSGGGGGGGGGGGSSGSENCSNGTDDDGDGAVDCADPDCAANAQCLAAPDVTVVQNTIPDVTLGGTVSHFFQATGGDSAPQYFWNMPTSDPALGATLALNLWTGQLSGAVAACPGSYSVDVKAEDRNDAANNDQKSFAVTVVPGTLSVNPPPLNGGPGTPDFTVTSSTFQQDFAVTGDYIGPFTDTSAWAINWVAGDPGGFQIDPLSDTQARLRKSGSSTAGDYAFTLTVTDDACPTNTRTTGSYALTVTAAGEGAPFTDGLVGYWQMDGCGWNGTAGEVLDSGDNAFNGMRLGDANTAGSGRLCRGSGYDGSGDYVRIDDASKLRLAPPFSVAAWVRVHANASDWVRLVGKGDNTNRNYGLWLATNGTVLFQVYGSGGNGGAQTGVTINDGRWHHVAGVYDGAALKTYVDGVERASVNYSQPPRTSADPLTFGYATFHTYLKGKLDEVMLFNKALSETEIGQILSLTKTSCGGACYGGPVAEYQMELDFPWNGTAGEIKDSAGTSNGVTAARGSGALPSQTAVGGGKVCRAARLTRVDANNGGFLNLGDPVSGDLDPGTSPMTITGWINWDGSTGDNMIFNKENLYEARVAGGVLQYAWQPHWAWDGGSSFPVTANTWTQFTIVYDGHQQILYKDGAEVFSRAQTGAVGSNGNPLRLGARGTTTPYNFYGGLMDEFRLYKRALAVNEIEQLVTASHSCPADTVIIDGIDKSTLTLGQTLTAGSGILPAAVGGTLPYVWQLVSSAIPGLTLADNLTGEVVGTVDTCAGSRDLTLAVTDNGLGQDQRTFALTVNNPTLVPTPTPGPVIDCNNKNFNEAFSVSGGRLGEFSNWSLTWQGANPGGFAIVKTGANTAAMQKSGASTTGNYRFKLTAQDASCPSNALDTGFYDISVNPGCQMAP